MTVILLILSSVFIGSVIEGVPSADVYALLFCVIIFAEIYWWLIPRSVDVPDTGKKPLL